MWRAEYLVLTDGQTRTAARAARLPTDPGIDFTPGPDDACWCPDRYVLSADAATVWVLLRRRGGLVPGTEEKFRDEPGLHPVLVAVDRATGADLSRIEIGFDCPSDVCLTVADAGVRLLFTVLTPETGQIIGVDPVTGRHQILLTTPAGPMIILPGQIAPSNGDG